MDKKDFMHFVNSVRWYCTISMKTTRLNEEIDRAVWGVCDLRPECTKMQFSNRIFIDQNEEHRAGKFDGFCGLATLFEQLDKSGRVSFN